ncbi:MAG TPA: hypothetical protein DHN29_16030, partial [Cytophagales bacterium]|nr:hypothetical protein [Cytophagales bacterium]
YKNKITFDNIPPDIVEEYGRGDVVTTTELYRDQLERYNEEHNRGLLPTLKMMCTFTLELVEMERNGMKIDLKALDAVKQEYITEYYELEERLYELAREAVGDTPIQLSSPVFRSKLIYSRRIVNIEDWKRVFVIGMDDKGRVQQKAHYKQTKFNQILKNMTRPVFKTKATHCEECNGKGWVYKETKAGKPFKRHPACRSCVEGVKYVSTGEKAGFGVTPPHSEFTSASGFSTSKEMIGKILSDYHGDEKAKEFLTLYSRFNKIATYLSTFIDGIEKHVQDDGLLHTSLNQAVASTARLSSSSPNLQNQPRGKTFPVRRAFVSRFLLGCISESDYAQLEFRMAGCLSGCPVVFSDTREGVDVHAFTRDTINAFDPRLNQIDRQGAKSDTFKPLYGGKSGTPRQRHYYESFLEKYSGVQSWQEKLLSTACSKRTIVLPTGREYRFGAARRLPSGYVRGTTQIVNWPVQGFATADVVPLGVIAASRLFKKHELKSLLIMTIHDSLVVDVYPGELDQVRELLLEGMLQIPEMMKEFYDIEFDYPLEVGNKFGPNLLETSNEITKQRGYENDNCVGMWRP